MNTFYRWGSNLAGLWTNVPADTNEIKSEEFGGCTFKRPAVSSSSFPWIFQGPAHATWTPAKYVVKQIFRLGHVLGKSRCHIILG